MFSSACAFFSIAIFLVFMAVKLLSSDSLLASMSWAILCEGCFFVVSSFFLSSFFVESFEGSLESFLPFVSVSFFVDLWLYNPESR